MSSTAKLYQSVIQLLIMQAGAMARLGWAVYQTPDYTISLADSLMHSADFGPLRIGWDT